MSGTISRRSWLRSSAFATAGMALAHPAYSLNRLVPAAETIPKNDGLIWLDQNENPYGISENARTAILDNIIYSNRYPEVGKDLIAAIAERENVTPKHIVLGAGSSEILYTAGYIYGADGGEVVFADPTFHGFMNYVAKVSRKLIRVPLDNDFEHDLEAMEQQVTNRTSLVHVCNPNNPTGTIVDSRKLRLFCEEVSKRSLVMVDEAYNELVDDRRYESMVDLVRKGANVLILRTFSKVFGLAGLRIGYGIAKPDIISKIKRVQGNAFPVSVLSLHAALASYKDTDFIEFSRVNNAKSRSYLYGVLEKLGYFHIPSHTNFVLFKSEIDSIKFVEEIKKRKIVIRPFYSTGENWIRVSMGTLSEMNKLKDALEDIT